jgi:prepilin-type N-terminal cleavage/methylation domain-containing protein
MMRPNLRRLKGFTLLELVVVLAVSALLFRLAYAALGLVQGQQRVFERHSATLGQISTWQNALAADFRHARRIDAAAAQLSCQLPGSVVVYSWPDSLLIRQQGQVSDTLVVPVREHTTFWQTQPRTQGRVDEASFLVVAARDTFYIQATAHYAAQQLLPDSLTLLAP